MSRIPLPNGRHLFLGTLNDAKTQSYDHVLSVINEREMKHLMLPDNRGSRYWLNISDRPDATDVILAHVDEVVDFLNAACESYGSSCLVHCRQGRSRSPTVVLIYLIRQFDMTVMEAENHLSKTYSYRLAPWFRDFLDEEL